MISIRLNTTSIAIHVHLHRHPKQSHLSTNPWNTSGLILIQCNTIIPYHDKLNKSIQPMLPGSRFRSCYLAATLDQTRGNVYTNHCTNLTSGHKQDVPYHFQACAKECTINVWEWSNSCMLVNYRSLPIKWAAIQSLFWHSSHTFLQPARVTHPYPSQTCSLTQFVKDGE